YLGSSAQIHFAALVPGSIRAELFYGNGSNSSAKLGPASALTSSSEDGVYNFPVYVTLPTANVSILFTLLNASGVYVTLPTANVSILFTLLNASGFSLGITARTDFFEVATNATSLVFVRKPPAILVASVPFATVVHVEDRLVNARVTGHADAEARRSAACPTLRGTTTVAVSRGIASFSDLSLTRCNAQPANASLPRNDACSQAKNRIVFKATVASFPFSVASDDVSAKYRIVFKATVASLPFSVASDDVSVIIAKYRIVFKATVASLPFTVASDDVSVIIGPATALTVLTSASSVAAGKPFSPLPEIVVVDAGGNRVTSFVSQEMVVVDAGGNRVKWLTSFVSQGE
ncbi:hypothetical protein T484DRAFT_1763887, partial [Baffinella frigidus]